MPAGGSKKAGTKRAKQQCCEHLDGTSFTVDQLRLLLLKVLPGVSARTRSLCVCCVGTLASSGCCSRRGACSCAAATAPMQCEHSSCVGHLTRSKRPVATQLAASARATLDCARLAHTLSATTSLTRWRSNQWSPAYPLLVCLLLPKCRVCVPPLTAVPPARRCSRMCASPAAARHKVAFRKLALTAVSNNHGVVIST